MAALTMKALVLVTLAVTAVWGQSDFTDQATKQFLGMLFAPFGSKPSATAAASAPLYEAASRPLRSSVHHDEPEYSKPTYSLTPPRSYRRPESPYRAPASSYPRSKSRSGPWISPPEEHWVPPPSHWESQPWNPPKPKHGAVTIKIRPAAPEEDHHHHHHHSWEDHSHDHSHDHGHGHGWHIKKKPHYKTVDAKIRIPPVKFRLHVSPKIRIVSGTKDPLERPPPPEPEEHFPWEKPSTGWEKPTWKPPSGWEKYASSGWDKPHSGGWDRPHSGGWDKHHSSGWEKHPSSGWEKHPSSGWDRYPSSGWEKPTRGWERPPSGGWERSSQSGGWEKPAASGWEHYSSSGSWHSPSGGWKPDTSAWDKFATGWDDSHHKHFKPHHRHYPPDYPRYDPKFRIKVHPHIVTDPPPSTTTTTTEAPTSSSLRNEPPKPEERADRVDTTTAITTTTTESTTAATTESTTTEMITTTNEPITTTTESTTMAEPTTSTTTVEPTTYSEKTVPPTPPTTTFYAVDPSVDLTTPGGLEREAPTPGSPTEKSTLSPDEITMHPSTYGTDETTTAMTTAETTAMSTSYTEPYEERDGGTSEILPEKRSRDPSTTEASNEDYPENKNGQEKPSDPRFHTIDDERAYKRDHGNKAETTTVDETSSEVASTKPTATQTTPVESDEHNEVTIKKPESSAKPSKVDRDLPLIADPSSPEEVSATGLNA